VSQDARGGFLSSDSVRNKDSLVVDVLLANYLAHAVVVRHKYDVIDMHFMFTQQQQRCVTLNARVFNNKLLRPYSKSKLELGVQLERNFAS